MNTLTRVCSRVVLQLAVAAFSCGAIGAYAQGTQPAQITQPSPPSQQATSQDDARLIERGRYLATAADCTGCHTAPQGKPMAGGRGIDSPFGQIYASNITPSTTHGIGNYSEAQFARAVREGVDASGKHLYPAMPYPSYAGIDDADIKALYAYFMQGVQPVDADTPETQLPFPFSQRWAMAGWNLLFANGKPEPLDASQSALWNRGRYLVTTLGHCGACHTPRNVAMAEQSGAPLAGGQLGAWRTPNITSDAVSGIGGWSNEELVQYLRTGKAAGKAQAAGGMAEAIENSLQYLSDADLNAIATYLKATPPAREPFATKPAFSYEGGGDSEGAANYEAALRATNQGIGTGSSTPGYPKLTTGAQLYSGNCASCHQPGGEGTHDGAFPSLMHNSVLGRDNADNLVNVILNGLHIETAKDARLMPGFADELSDDQIARIATFVMSEYGNPNVTVDAQRVKTLREGGDSPVDGMKQMALVALLAVLLMVVAVCVWLRKRCRRARQSAL